MATEFKNVEYLLEQMAGAGELRSRAMFGEYAIYCNEKVIAFVCDNQLFMKIVEGSHAFLDATHEAPAYPGSKNYLLVPEEKWDDREWLRDFVRVTEEQVPLPKPKKKKDRA